MKDLERIGVSLEQKLLRDFDKLIAGRGYESRSEALRDLIRQELSSQKSQDSCSLAVAAVCLVYDHHGTALMQKLTSLQHNHLLETISSMHIHINTHDCMEIIVLKGRVGDIENVAEKIISQKGVKLGKINLIAIDGQ